MALTGDALIGSVSSAYLYLEISDLVRSIAHRDPGVTRGRSWRCSDDGGGRYLVHDVK
jgi:hypothetical protein